MFMKSAFPMFNPSKGLRLKCFMRTNQSTHLMLCPVSMLPKERGLTDEGGYQSLPFELHAPNSCGIVLGFIA